MHWTDLLKLWTYQFERDPLSKATQAQFTGAGVTQPDAIPDIRQDGSFWGGGGKGSIRLRDTNDFIDLSSVTNRTNRYKEYERLRNVPEIENAVTVMADEACVAGHTKVATPFYGFKTIRWLAENKANERFLVYCWDFDKNDYALGWAFEPRLVKKEKTVKVKLDDGTHFICTVDHRILLRNGSWQNAGNLDWDDELMPFYHINAPYRFKDNQFPRIFTFQHGWKTERNFIDEWRVGGVTPKQEESYEVCRLLSGKVTIRDAAKLVKHDWKTLEAWMHKSGFKLKELRDLGRKANKRKVIHVLPHDEELEVFDLSVEKHHNFCGESVIFHNCQKGENRHVCTVSGVSDEIKEELEKILFNRNFLNLDRKIWGLAKNLFMFGDHFAEVIINPENPKEGIYKTLDLPADSMYRIETTKGKLVEFQQSNEGPDYQSLMRVSVTQATDADLKQATAVRFAENQVIHWKIGDDRKMFYPYGVSLIEPARGPAHQLRLMEDAMVVYRLCLTGRNRIMTPNGWKYIKDIKTNDTVYSYDGTQKIPVTVLWQKNNGKKEVWKLRSQHIEIIGTPDHPILVNRKGKIQYVELQNLKPRKDKLINITRNDEVQIKIPKIISEKWAKLDWSQKTAFRNTHYENKSELMRKCGLDDDRVKQFLYAEGKALPYEQAVKICNIFSIDENKLKISNKGEIHSERINLPEYVDEDFARLFGFLIGDGCIPNDEFGYRLAFAASPDKQLNALYAGLLEKYFGRVGFSQDKRSSHIECGNYTVCSQVVCRTFIEMGFIPGARNKRIPNWVFTAPKNIRKAFVEGISDADGCERYTKAGLWFSTIEICNKDLVADIKEVWHSIGLCSGKVSSRKRNGGHEIELGRKMPPTESHYVTITSRELPKYENVWKVEKLEEEQEVYDIEVSGNEHNFVANCTPVHNSRAPERRVFYIDVSTLSPSRAEAFMERIKDQFRKKKVASNRGQQGVNAIEERWHPPAIDEDYWLPIRPNSNTRIDTLAGACLDLNTKIPLLDGRILSLSEIIEEHNQGKKLWTYSCCPNTGKSAPGLISWAGVTRKNTQVLKVNFDNGKSITCTPDHKFPVQGKGKIEAKDLQVGDSMFPFITRMENLSNSWQSKYEQIYDNFLRDWMFTHRMVMKEVVNTSYEETTIFDEKNKDLKKKVIHHKNYNHFNNSPENLTWMNYVDHLLFHREHQEITNENISKALKLYHQNMSENDKKIRDKKLSERGIKGNLKTLENLKNKNFNLEFRKKQIEGWKKAFKENPELHKKRGLKITARNNEFWSNPENKKQVFDKQTIIYPKSLFDKFIELQKQGCLLPETLNLINQDKELINQFVKANSHIVHAITKKALPNGFTNDHAKKMCKAYGYNGIKHARKEAVNYNHKVISIEFLEEKMDTGTLTIDANHEVHNYHTFAVSGCGIYTCNSNLGEIDDALYFRNKLYTALNFPKNYFASEDPQVTRISLSAQDIKFARMIERLQAHVEDGLIQLCEIHLQLLGIPEEKYDELQIKLTPPSDWRELSKQEITNNRINNANALKGSMLMSDFDILTTIMQNTDEESQKIIARMKIQKLEDFKLQVLAANPQLLGIGVPASEGENEMGAVPGGPNPMMGPEMGGMPGGGPPGGGAPMPGMQPEGGPPMMSQDGQPETPEPGGASQPQGAPLPDADPEDIKKYDLEIQNYAKEQDVEEIDHSER